jgi:hypothetical protein
VWVTVTLLLAMTAIAGTRIFKYTGLRGDKRTEEKRTPYVPVMTGNTVSYNSTDDWLPTTF